MCTEVPQHKYSLRTLCSNGPVLGAADENLYCVTVWGKHLLKREMSRSGIFCKQVSPGLFSYQIILTDLEEVVKIQDFLSIPNIIDENGLYLTGMEIWRPRFKFLGPEPQTRSAVFCSSLEILS